MKIKYKLLLSFAIMTILPLIFVAGIIFYNLQNALTVEIYQKIDISAQLKMEAIENFYKRLRDDVLITQDYFNIKNNLPILIKYQNTKNSPEYILAKKTLDSQLRTLQLIRGFQDIMLTDLNGRIVYATNPLHGDVDADRNISELGSALTSLDGKNVSISPIFKNEVTKRDYDYGIFAYGPAKDISNKQIGGIIFEMDARLLYEILAENIGLGKTGETLIGEEIHPGKITYLSPLRKTDSEPLMTKISAGGAVGKPMLSAVLNKNFGQGISLDYAGEEVISSWRYIPSRNWGMVVKIDTEEAFREINYLKYAIFSFLIVLLMGIGIAILKISGTISFPIEKLQRGAKIITGGNLTYKVGINTKDEVGDLAIAFDEMTTELRKSRDELSSKVEEKTKELAKKVIELEKMNSFMVDREIKMIELKKENFELKNESSKK